MNRNQLIIPKDENISNSSSSSEKNNDIEYILLQNVLAGTGRLGFFGCDSDCALGRAQEYYRFRNYLFHNIFYSNISGSTDMNYDGNDKHKTAKKKKKGYILFSLPAKSSRPDKVYNFKDEINAARKIYGNDIVKVVDIASMSMQAQAMLLDETAVLLTNHGGGGSASILLPFGSAAIVYWHGNHRFEHQWYESAGYFRVTWVGVDERPYLNATMALIDDQVVKTHIQWE